MNREAVLAILFALALCGCRSITVRGVVSDALTGEPVWPCSVSMGGRSAVADLAGRYRLQARKRPPTKKFSSSRSMEVLCKGYERKVVEVTWDETRYPTVNVPMTPAQK